MARIGVDGLDLCPRPRRVPPVVPEDLGLGMCRRPVVEGGPARLVPAVAVHEQKAAEALAMQCVDQLPEHGAVRLCGKRGAARVRSEVRRDPVRERREDGDTERLRRLDRDPLGENLIDREREVGVLLDGAERKHDPIVLPQILLELHPVAVLDPHPASRS